MKENLVTYLFPLLRFLHRHWNTGRVACRIASGLFAGGDPAATTQQPPLGQGAMETCFGAGSFGGKQPDKLIGLQSGHRSEEQGCFVI